MPWKALEFIAFDPKKIILSKPFFFFLFTLSIRKL